MRHCWARLASHDPLHRSGPLLPRDLRPPAEPSDRDNGTSAGQLSTELERSAPSEPLSTTEPVPESRVKTGFTRWLLFVLGLLFMALASVGVFLPVLPTTPFLLLAAACLMRSSPAFYRRLLANRVFGPYISQWQHDHTVPREAKRKAYGTVLVTFAISIALVGAPWLRIMLAGIGIGLIVFLAWLPTTTAEEEESAQPPD